VSRKNRNRGVDSSGSQRNIPTKLSFYYINLELRSERKQNVLSQLEDAGAIGIRINADIYDPDIFPKVGFMANRKYYSKIVANRDSHIVALRTFLASGDSYGVIAEDDMFFTSRKSYSQILKLVGRMSLKDINFLQVGYLPHGITKASTKSWPVARLGNLLHIMNSLVNAYIFSGRRIIFFNLRFGAHAYVVDKNSAAFLIRRFEAQQWPNFHPIDVEFRNITARDTDLIFARSAGSLIDQSIDYPSDLQTRRSNQR